MIIRRAVVAAVALAILALTLAPSGNRPPEPFSFCVACGPRGLADGILNLWLFVPLGLALGWRYRRPSGIVLFGSVLSTAIELAQTLVPGRDPSLSDIIFNTLGIAFGALIARRPRTLLRPDRKAALILTMSSLVLVTTVMLATAFLLSPAGASSFVGRSGNDLVLRYTTRASRIGLDEPEYRLVGVRGNAADDPPAVAVRRDRSRWLIQTAANDETTLGPTVGQGWALVAYPDAMARRWGRMINGFWMVALFLPIGFWARGRVLAIAIAMAALLMALIPVAIGVLRTGTEEWMGAAIGILVGVTLRLLSSRVAALSASARPQ